MLHHETVTVCSAGLVTIGALWDTYIEFNIRYSG